MHTCFFPRGGVKGYGRVRVYLESQLPIIIGNFPLISYYFGLK